MIEGTDFSIIVKEKIALVEDYIEKWFKYNDAKSTKDVRRKDTVKLPKMEITKFSGKPMEWQTFLDTYTAVIHNSKTLSNVEKFTYLRSYIEKDALHAISGISLTNDNYDKAWELLQERFGNTQVIITSHMNELLKMRKITSEKDLQGMRKLYDDVKNHVRCLQSLGVHGGQYGPLLSPVIMDRLPIQFKLTVSRHLKTDLWDLTKLLELIRDEIRARENVSAIEGSTREDEGKNSSNVREYIEKPHTDAVLTSQSTPKSRCIFCKAFHWSDKCKVISDIEARKEFLRKGKRCFLCMREGHFANSCQKTKPCFYCKKFHHSAICNERNKNEDSPRQLLLIMFKQKVRQYYCKPLTLCYSMAKIN